jgi:ArsR family metal-binding transcriptional regulator
MEGLMAGSLNHIIAPDGRFMMHHIENLRDAREALEEFHQVIAHLARQRGGKRRLESAMDALAFPQPDVVPVIQPELHGADSIYKSAAP